MKNSFIKKLPFEVGRRASLHVFHAREHRRDGFVSFISGMSVLSIAVGVMALIVVLCRL